MPSPHPSPRTALLQSPSSREAHGAANHSPEQAGDASRSTGSPKESGTKQSPRMFTSRIPRLAHKSSSLSTQELRFEGDVDPLLYPEPGNSDEIAPSASNLLPPPDFKPFFTLIEDSTTGHHYHPTVHYLFSDDDPDILTEACARAIDSSSASSSMQGREVEVEGSQKQHGSRTGVEERFLVIDVGADGGTVNLAQSFSENWQVLDIQISQAPTWNAEDSGEIAGSPMLTIRGVGAKWSDESAAEAATATPSRTLDEAASAAGNDVVAGMQAIAGKVRSEVEALHRVFGGLVQGQGV